MATTRIEAIQAKAITEIELASVEAQTQIAASGLTSEAARAFLDNLPQLEALCRNCPSRRSPARPRRRSPSN